MRMARRKGHWPADKGLHRVHPAEAARHQEDADPFGHGEAGTQGRVLHKAAVKLRHGEFQQRGHGLYFVGLDHDPAAADAAIAALLAVEHG